MAKSKTADSMDFDQASFNPNEDSGIRYKPTIGDVLGASYQLSSESTPVSSIEQIHEYNSAVDKGGDLVDPETLNQMHPDLQDPFREPQTKDVAELVAKRQTDRLKLAKIIADGPQGGMYSVAKYAAMIVPHAIDPINIGTSLAFSAVGGWLLPAEKLGETIEAVNTASKLAKAGQFIARSQFARHAVEGLAGNTAAEGFVATAAAQDGRQYDIEDAFLNVAGGALAFPSIAWAGSKAIGTAKFIGSSLRNKMAGYMGRIDSKMPEVVARSAAARMLNDKLPKSDLFLQDSFDELRGPKPGWYDGEYQYGKMDTEKNAGKRVFAVPDRTGVDVDSGVPRIADTDYYGDGLYLTDDPSVANGLAQRKIKDVDSEIVEMKLSKDANLLDLDGKVPDEAKASFEEFLGRKLKESDTGKALMSEIMDDVDKNNRIDEFTDFKTSLKESGFDGTLHSGDTIDGVKALDHNSVHLFDKEKIEEIRRIPPDTEATSGLPNEVLRQEQTESASQLSEMRTDNVKADMEEMRSIENTPFSPKDLTELDKAEADITESFDALDKQGLLDADDKKFLEDLKGAKVDEEQQAKLIKLAAECLGAFSE